MCMCLLFLKITRRVTGYCCSLEKHALFTLFVVSLENYVFKRFVVCMEDSVCLQACMFYMCVADVSAKQGLEHV